MVRNSMVTGLLPPKGVHKSVNLVLAQNALHHHVSQVLETNFGLGVADPPLVIGGPPSALLRMHADSPPRVHHLCLKDHGRDTFAVGDIDLSLIHI